ncbi:MAG TPA: VOC family protein [Pyrinomonadaceae bacterium]|jgi:methylmalonyl-CoA/ethylmalonyl-CoA epimerase|nr:VOC family protein [Pyrinomonadaceae bacterium]
MHDFIFHHVGIATSDIKSSIRFYEALGYISSDIYDDSVQKAVIALLKRPDSPLLELISPTDKASPVQGWVDRIRCGPYHVCYEVNNLEEGMSFLKERGSLVVYGPVPAIAFGLRQVAFLWGKDSGLTELLEKYPVQ